MTSTQTKAPKPAPAIHMNPVEKSSNIAATGYDPHSKTLAIQFKGGGKTYHYADVPHGLADELNKSESVGKFVVGQIVGKFKHTLQQAKAD
jgi:hypothetical protein